VLTLYVGDAITGAEIARRGAALVSVADAVTAAVGGHRPHLPHDNGTGTTRGTSTTRNTGSTRTTRTDRRAASR
jgi:hypothetical protein